jgi:hypothetical protein
VALKYRIRPFLIPASLSHLFYKELVKFVLNPNKTGVPLVSVYRPVLQSEVDVHNSILTAEYATDSTIYRCLVLVGSFKHNLWPMSRSGLQRLEMRRHYWDVFGAQLMR